MFCQLERFCVPQPNGSTQIQERGHMGTWRLRTVSFWVAGAKHPFQWCGVVVSQEFPFHPCLSKLAIFTLFDYRQWSHYQHLRRQNIAQGHAYVSDFYFLNSNCRNLDMISFFQIQVIVFEKGSDGFYVLNSNYFFRKLGMILIF